MLTVFKKFFILLLIMAVATNAFASSVSASNLMPADCMMTMMDDDSSMDSDCDCSMDGVSCQHCGLDIATTVSAILFSVNLVNSQLAGFSTYQTMSQRLDSVSLINPSPPPII